MEGENMGKNKPPVPANWADLAFSVLAFSEGIAMVFAQSFHNLAVTFALHSQYKDEQTRKRLRQDRFAEDAGREIESITRER